MRKPLILLTAVAALTACGSTETSADAPPYTVVDTFDGGNSQDVTVEVDSAENLEAVFKDVIADLDDDGGYYVIINCSTGATASSDNRLANGRYAVGNIGSAVTGLDEGESVFEVNEGRTCPA